MTITDRKLHVFLCHASQDRHVVRELYHRLAAEGWINPWIDEKKLLPGEDWRISIENAIESADTVIFCLSNYSVNKEGFVQKETRYAREIALEKPEGTIFLIPLRLQDCDVPRGFRFFQWANYFGEEKEKSYDDLLESLETRLRQILIREAEELTRKWEEEKVKREKEELLRREAEERAMRAAQELARKRAEETVRREVEARAKREREELARKEAEAKAREEEEERAKLAAEELARKRAEETVRKEVEARAKREREELARKEAEEKAHREAEQQALEEKRVADELDRKYKRRRYFHIPYGLASLQGLISVVLTFLNEPGINLLNLVISLLFLLISVLMFQEMVLSYYWTVDRKERRVLAFSFILVICLPLYAVLVVIWRLLMALFS